MGENDFGGLAFVEGGTGTSSSVLKIAFRIKSCMSGSILLGIGNPDNYAPKSYVMDCNISLITIRSRKFRFDSDFIDGIPSERLR